MRRARTSLLLTIATASSLLWSNPGVAATVPVADVAEFVINIARYTAWPSAAAPKSLTICYAHGGGLPLAATGADPAPSVKGVPVAWLAIASPKQTVGCNIVWLHSDVRPPPREWLASIADLPILTLSNYADFTADGGIIGAYRIGADWRFEVNLEALQRSHINIAAVALRLSQKPRPVPAPGPR